MNPVLRFLFCSFKCLQTKCFICGEQEDFFFTAEMVCSALKKKKKGLFQVTLFLDGFILLPD